MVGVFHHVPRLFRTARAEVYAIHGRGLRLFAPVAKFVQTHRIGFGGKPSQIQPLGAMAAHGILPLKAGDEIPTRIAHDGNAQIAHQANHIRAKPLFVRGRMAGLINALVNGAAHVLEKRAIDPRIDRADLKCLIQRHARMLHRMPFLHFANFVPHYIYGACACQERIFRAGGICKLQVPAKSWEKGSFGAIAVDAIRACVL